MRLLPLALVLVLVLAPGCDQYECPTPCYSELHVSTDLLAEGSVTVTVCDGPRSCDTRTLSQGECMEGRFRFCWRDDELTIVASWVVAGSPGALEDPVRITVTAADGDVLVDREGVPDVMYEPSCSGFPCTRRSIAF